jgi:hypothetical protein
MAEKKSQAHGPKSFFKRTVGVLLMVPISALVASVAGAFLTAMLFSVFTLNLEGVRSAAGVLLEGVFVSGILDTLAIILPVGMPVGVVVGCITLFLEKKEIAENGKSLNFWAVAIVALIAVVVVIVVAYTGYALLAIFQASLQMSPWGAYIGAASGALLGMAGGFLFAWNDDHKQKHKQRAVQPNGQKRGADFRDLDWWRADFDNDIDPD